jgi:hypothetical protein
MGGNANSMKLTLCVAYLLERKEESVATVTGVRSYFTFKTIMTAKDIHSGTIQTRLI